MNKSPKQQQGVVIIVALFIVALVAGMAYIMMARLERDTRRTSMILRNAQAEFYAQGSIAWAIDQLRTNFEKKKPNKLVDETPIKSPVTELNGYKITSTIYDMQSHFNLNNITSTDAQNEFKRLLQVVIPEMNEGTAQVLVAAVYDWITPMAQQTEFAKYYLGLAVPYRPARRPMTATSELRLVKGMTDELYNLLQPYLTVLPFSTQINIREAKAPVLVTLSKIMTPNKAKALAELRDQSKAEMITPKIFLNSDAVRQFQIPSEKVVEVSSYFLVETEVTIENQQLVLYTLLERVARDNRPELVILWQSKGIS